MVRVDKSGKNPTAFIPDEEAQRNNVKLVVTFQSGIIPVTSVDIYRFPILLL